MKRYRESIVMYDLVRLREEFPVLSRCVYLDSASTSQTPRRAVEAMCTYFYEYAANHGRGAHHLARRTTEEYEKVRAQLAGFLEASPEQIVFSKNTTESVNMVARGFRWKRGDHVITTMLEHHANLLPWMMLRDKGVRVTVVPHENGYINPVTVAEAITPRTRLVAITHMPNVLGTVQPVEEIGKMAHERGVPILVDGAQSVGHLPVDVTHIDYLAIPGHKGLLGPQGTGALYMKDPDSLECCLYGGGMVEHVSLTEVKLLPPPAKFEPGTPNIPGVIGLGPAIGLVEELGVDLIHRHEKKLGTRMCRGLSGIAGVSVYSPEGTGVVSFGVENREPNGFARALDDLDGICVRSGMHCAEPLTSSFDCRGTIRASVGCYTTAEEVDRLIAGVQALTGDRS
ncbi:cysteine desulfurase/selenocysteine lyase [Methanolinea mesophila]|uniref:cysteine desulfurase n=1 Tax=Methanolinea mesophila TaxID=547055 RepID=UPI001FD86850|nr:cysteine desulfurase [Methanolinea mesophila]MBP1928734.1 cysteine desulfurase/selenocysteine lyase [Methanolinea mesophila]